jgi:hypothetical protein
MRRDIDEALRHWPYDPGPGEILVRQVRGRDGRSLLQLRVELGILQLEENGRPDGVRPHGYETYLDYLRSRADGGGDGGSPWVMDPQHGNEADREFVQFYHRRIAWLALHRYDRALLDADHTLALMDFVARHGTSEPYIVAHERLRGIVLFHRAQAAAAQAIERRRPEAALDQLRLAREQLREHQRRWAQHFDDDELPDASLIEQLEAQEQEIRKDFGIGKTLRERLDEAVETEDYETAARLRDELRRQGKT